MAKVKRIVELDEKLINHLIRGGLNPSMVISNFDLDIADVIRDSKPYDDSGDLISRSALKETLTSETRDNYVFVCLSRVLEKIDNVPSVEDKQDELLNYIKLSLEKSDEFKEKYKNRHKESNSQYDLYYSHLFEGMAEAYADLLKKMGKSDTQGESKQGEWIPMSTDSRGYSESFKCSICGAYIYPRCLEKELDYNLCPYCGADMGGKEE